MADIESVQVGTDGSGDYQTIADVTARENIRNLEKVTITPLQDHPHLATNDTINQAFSKTEAWFNSLGQMAFKDNLTKSDVTSALDYDPQAADNDIRLSFQAGVNAVYDAVDNKGVTPASKSLEDIVTAIGQIETGGNYATLEVSEDGTYTAAEDPRGIDAYDIVVVSKDVGQPHSVVFYGPDGHIIKTEANVPYHGSASCTILDGTTREGQYFVGQNPSPYNVVIDLQCYPEYGEYIIEPIDIQDSQETICADGGAHYPIGSQKPLIITLYKDEYAAQYNSFDGIGEGVGYLRASNANASGRYFLISGINSHTAFLHLSCHMIKVAEGEDGTHSTWISSGCVSLTPSANQYINSGYLDGSSITNETVSTYSAVSNYGSAVFTDYSDSAIRYLIETILYRGLPTALKENIKYVHKVYKGVENNALQSKDPLDKTVIAPIWALSRKELSSYIANNLSVDSSVKWDPEYSGIDYSAQYMPSYHANYPRIYLRSMGAFTSDTRWTNHFAEVRASDNLLRVGHESNNGDQTVYVPFGFCF